jgi:hypothetical protein
VTEHAAGRADKHSPGKNAPIDKDDLVARAAYAAYGEVTGGTNFQGQPLPAYDDLGDTIQRAWQAAAVASRTWI